MSPATFALPRITDIERGNCGIGFIADRYGRPSHAILEQAIAGLSNMQHRGGLSSDTTTGDGAGIMVAIPHRFFAERWAELTGFYPNPEDLAVGMFFFNAAIQHDARREVEAALRAQGIRRFLWRVPPTNPSVLGNRARATLPIVDQVLCIRPPQDAPDNFERRLFLARKQFERNAAKQQWTAYTVSLSARTLVYKGLMLAPQLAGFYLDLQHPDFAVSIATFHQRYSTNTLPSWERAQPFRRICHNGEINTLQGNIAWAYARAPMMSAEFTDDLHFTPDNLTPVLDLTGSDSAMLDNMVELLQLAGRDLRHAMAMLLPAAWEADPLMLPAVRDFYAYHAHLQEPWDGPAAVIFTDGHIVGATLDRNGLRPLRYTLTHDGLLVVASEDGAVPIPEADIAQRGKLGPGQMIAADTTTGDILTDPDLKAWLAGRRPYADLFDTLTLPDTPDPAPLPDLLTAQAAFGYTHEESIVMLRPMAEDGKEPTGSMGDDTAPAVLSPLGRPLFAYFRQRFAEVTNPAIDPLRETLVMSLTVRLGPTGNRLDENTTATQQLILPSPVLAPAQVEQILAHPKLRATRLPTHWPVSAGTAGLATALETLLTTARTATEQGAGVLILSDRGVDARHTFIPALLAVSAVHHDLVRSGLRGKVSLMIESGEPRDVHHLATLIGFGAEAVCPYVAWQAIAEISRDIGAETAQENYRKALESGLRKVMSKMGISTLDSYCAAQTFEIIGLATDLVDRYFTGTVVHAPGATLADLSQRVLRWHTAAYGPEPAKLASPGYYKFKRQGEAHAFSPATVQALQAAVRMPNALNGNFSPANERFQQLSDRLTHEPPTQLRDLLTPRSDRTPIALELVENRSGILRRFSTGAMSHGALSSEAHETLAIGMNRLGAWSNSGEGGEHPNRYNNLSNDRIKQVASGRFGVTPAYLLSADELQIKVAQGAKPGEGGQLPGFKVSEEIAAIRHSQPGITLISPPPHHDIYSIEDLAQLIFDLRQINPRAQISVKLVAQAGVGTIAAGVAKAGADIIAISGHSGGTGAAAWTSIKAAGLPWELGLHETQQALVTSGLRGGVRLRVDGGFRTGRDVIIAALLGADEFSFGTSALIALGCVMARACHRNTCPTGIATQRADLRAKFSGTPDHLMAYMTLVAEDVRRGLAELGYPRLQDIIGRSNLLKQTLPGLPGEPALDLSALCRRSIAGRTLRFESEINPLLQRFDPLNLVLRTDAGFNARTVRPLKVCYTINNSNRTFGALLSSDIISQHGPDGLPANTIEVEAHGVAGQSFGAFNAPGLTLRLRGGANDYVGKGMSGGLIIIAPHPDYRGAHPTLAGNTVLYGATGGELYIAGRAGERFAVRNSGATAVVEGVGDHGCEYMTGGTVAILGRVGLNFGAGFTGGEAFILDPDNTLAPHLNPDAVAHPLSPTAAERLHTLLTAHHQHTASPIAARLLADWPTATAQFRWVRPSEQATRPELPTNEPASEALATP